MATTFSERINKQQEVYKVDVPVGVSGEWEVERRVVTEDEAKLGAMRAAFSMGAGRGRHVPAGTYTGLKRNGYLVMSDTPDEIRDFMEFVRMAEGNVLINGLGLGVVTNAVLLKDDVEHVTVVESSEDVISLVAEHWLAKHPERLTVIAADAMEYKPPKGERYNAVWHDIWDDICSDNLPAMKTLHRKYGRRSDWQGSWCRGLCELGR